MRNFLYITTLIVALCLTACDGSMNSSINGYPVNLDINIAAEYPHFVPDNIMQYMTFTSGRLLSDRVGYGGILVITGLDAKYHAFDLSCPVECRRDIRVEVDGLFAVCPMCGEKYDIFYGIGNPTQGIAHETLRRYTCLYTNGILHVTQ